MKRTVSLALALGLALAGPAAGGTLDRDGRAGATELDRGDHDGIPCIDATQSGCVGSAAGDVGWTDARRARACAGAMASALRAGRDPAAACRPWLLMR